MDCIGKGKVPQNLQLMTCLSRQRKTFPILSSDVLSSNGLYEGLVLNHLVFPQL